MYNSVTLLWSAFVNHKFSNSLIFEFIHTHEYFWKLPMAECLN